MSKRLLVSLVITGERCQAEAVALVDPAGHEALFENGDGAFEDVEARAIAELVREGGVVYSGPLLRAFRYEQLCRQYRCELFMAFVNAADVKVHNDDNE